MIWQWLASDHGQTLSLLLANSVVLAQNYARARRNEQKLNRNTRVLQNFPDVTKALDSLSARVLKLEGRFDVEGYSEPRHRHRRRSDAGGLGSELRWDDGSVQRRRRSVDDVD